MNPNYNGATDQEPDTMDANEPSENEMSFSTSDYPQLEGMKQGDPVKLTCQGKVSNSDNGQVSISIEPGSCEFETEGQADKAMKSMSQQDNMQPSSSQGQGEDF